jgi:glycosyltransferase involved in cell wall biosynthesis
MAKKDQGWDLIEVVKSFGLDPTTDVIFPENFGPNQGYPRQIVNMIYNISDCVISTTLGEGWGLSWIEAMATKTPVIMPGNTALVENIDKDKGWLVNSGTNPSLYTVVPNDNEVIRPLVDVDDMVVKMLEVKNNPEEATRRTENAYNWIVTKMDWTNSITPKWVTVFDQAYSSLISGVKEVETTDDINTITAESF